MTSDLPASYSQMLQLPLHKIDHAAPGGSATGGGSNADPSNTPRRSLSQSLLAQMSGPAFGMSRSPSPSPLLNSLRRGPRSGFGSHGPSLQSLVQSFVNKVSRGTQTDCDDNFDQVSIASAATGFSVMASDLTRNRIKMFLNDRTMAANDVDVNEFAEELHKLRYQIDGRFNDFEDNQSVQFDDNDFEHENANIICRDDKFSQDQIKSNHQPGHGPVTNFQLNNGNLSQIVEHQQMAAPVPGKAVPSRTGSQKKTNGTANAKTETSPSSSSSSPPATAAESAPCKAKSAPKLTSSSYDTDYGITEHIQQNRKPGSATRGRSTPASPISSSNGKSTLNTTTTTTASSPAKSPKKSSTKKHIIAGADDDPNKTTLLLADTKADPKCCSIT